MKAMRREALPVETPRPRPPEFLMRPERLAALQPGPLSTGRTLVAQMIAGRWKIDRLRFDLDDRGRGRALYRVDADGMRFDFPVFSFEPKLEGRTGRIVGRRWDMMAALVEGTADESVIEQTARAMPRLYGGRAAPRTLNWCRSNRSSRIFEHAVERLAAGQQPDRALLGQACYIMRNTGIEGNGTVGTRSFLALEDDHALRRPLAAQMLCAYLMRCFATDLLHQQAQLRNPHAATLSPEWQRYLGVGNGSALGLVLFAYNHPKLIDRWLQAHETALAAAKFISRDKALAELPVLLHLLDRLVRFRREDRMTYDALAPSALVAGELQSLRDLASTMGEWHDALPFAVLVKAAEQCHPETQESLHALLIEFVPEIVASLRDGMAVEEEFTTQPTMRVGTLRDILHAEYAWALAIDAAAPARNYVWYKSAAAEEPRRGPRGETPRAHDLGLDLPHLTQLLERALSSAEPCQSVARFLLGQPALRAIVARVQTLHGLHYHSPQADITGEDFVPIHIVRLMNAGLYGIDKTRDYLGRNLRGVMFHGAPLPAEIAAGADPYWFNPAEPAE